MDTIITFTNATLGYGRTAVLRGVSFAISRGEYFGLVGPNGTGKTTILRAILGSLRPMSGTVAIGGLHGTPLRFGYVPQRETVESILPHTVEEIVTMGRYRQIGLFRRPGTVDRGIVSESLEHVGIASLRHQVFRDLSGGQKQRALIARALASRPEVLLLDEPTNGMDLSSRLSILQLIDRLHSEDHLTIIMVSHLLDDVANHARRIAIVERDFFQVGAVDVVLTGENLSSLYRMPVRVERRGGQTIILAGGPDERHHHIRTRRSLLPVSSKSISYAARRPPRIAT